MKLPTRLSNSKVITTTIFSSMIWIAISDGKISQHEKMLLLMFMFDASEDQDPFEHQRIAQSIVDLYDERGFEALSCFLSEAVELPIDERKVILLALLKMTFWEGEDDARRIDELIRISDFLNISDTLLRKSFNNYCDDLRKTNIDPQATVEKFELVFSRRKNEG